MIHNPPTLSARELHELLVLANAASHTGRKRFIDALATLQETHLYKQLGFPSVYAYAEATFRYHRSRVHEFITVSRALASLPRIAAAFERGELSFHLASRLSAVATGESEGPWLDFLGRRRVAAALAEIREAKRKGRKEPRKDGFGLPGLPAKVSFELTAEEHALFEKGLQKARGEIAQSLQGAELETKEVLLLLLRRLLDTEPGDTLAPGRGETGISPFTVVVHKCPECARAALDTEAGKVELESGALARIEQEAERVVPEGERDQRNTPALRRSVCQRDGGRCQNPCCGRQVGREGHGHHIELRSHGGRTELANETFLCGLCHALVHAGLLVIDGDPVRGLTFRARAESWTGSIRKELEAAQGLPAVRTVEATLLPRGAPASASPDAEEVKHPARAVLEKLGCTRSEARRRVERALKRRGDQEELSVGDLVKEAPRL